MPSKRREVDGKKSTYVTKIRRTSGMDFSKNLVQWHGRALTELTFDIPIYLKVFVNSNGKGLSRKGVGYLFDLKSMVDFDDCFGARDVLDASVLENHVTREQDDRIWDKLRETYGWKRVCEVLRDKYGGEGSCK